MLIRVHVTPNAREASVIKVDEVTFEVRVDERATHGRANKSLLEIMSKYLGVPKSRVFIVRGAKSRDKIIEVRLAEVPMLTTRRLNYPVVKPRDLVHR